MATTVVWHRNCWDGHCSAWLFHRAGIDAAYVAAQYGDDPPACDGDTVYVADFSYPRAVLRGMADRAAQLVVLDHHQSAQEDLVGFSRGYDGNRVDVRFDMDKSGGRLTWDYLRGKTLLAGDPPWLVPYTEDRDLWRWALPKSREINAAIRSYPLDFAVWDELAQMDPMGILVQEGAAILRRERQIIDDHLAHAYEVRLAGHRVPFVNGTTLFSDIAGELAVGRPFGVCWFQREDRRFQYSLRSDEQGADVAAVAKQFGGGGHKHASGFTSDVLLD